MLVIVLMSVIVCMFDRVRGNGHDQPAVLDALQSDEPVGKLLHARRLAVDDEHLKAGFVVEMGVAGGDHQVVILVLHFGELFRDAVRMVVVDQRDRAYNR